jgi:hypothetical protein
MGGKKAVLISPDKDPIVGVRMSEELQTQIKAWATKQDDDPPLATAVRRLVEIGLKARKG